MIISHLGVGLLILGITGSSVKKKKKIINMKTDAEINIRHLAIQEATKIATYSPLSILDAFADVMPLAKLAVNKGNPNSISDAGVAAEMAHAGAQGGAMNVLINLTDIEDEAFCNEMKIKVEGILLTVNEQLMDIRKTVISALL